MRFNWYSGQNSYKSTWFIISNDFEYLIDEITGEKWKLIMEHGIWFYISGIGKIPMPGYVNKIIENFYHDYSKLTDVDKAFLKLGYEI